MFLLLIDTRVVGYTTIIDSRKEGVEYVLLEYSTDTYNSLLEKIGTVTNGQQIDSIALVSDGVFTPTFSFLESESSCILKDVSSLDPPLSTWNGWKYFWTAVGAPIIDLLGCAIYMDENWRYVLTQLESTMGVNFRASVDKTGNLAVGANWVLESDNVDVRDIYFTDDIEAWLYVLGNTSDNSIIMTYPNSDVIGYGVDSFITSIGTYFAGLNKTVQRTSIGDSHMAIIATSGAGSTLNSSNGELWMVGDNTFGQIGPFSTTTTPQLITQCASGTTHIACGANFTYAICRGRLYSFGRNNFGQLGRGNLVDSSAVQTPMSVGAVSFTSRCIDVACGSNHCVIMYDNPTQGIQVYGVGRNFYGQLAEMAYTGSTTYSAFTQMSRSNWTNITMIACSAFNTYAIWNNRLYSVGKLYAIDNGGLLGVSSVDSAVTYYSSAQTTGPDFQAWTATWQLVTDLSCSYVAAGYHHACGIFNGALKGWGSNTNKQLGNPTVTTGFHVPTNVKNQNNQNILTSGCTSVLCNQFSTMVINNGSVWIAGDNSGNNLGITPDTSSNFFRRLDISALRLSDYFPVDSTLNYRNNVLSQTPIGIRGSSTFLNYTLTSDPNNAVSSLDVSSGQLVWKNNLNEGTYSATISITDPYEPLISTLTRTVTYQSTRKDPSGVPTNSATYFVGQTLSSSSLSATFRDPSNTTITVPGTLVFNDTTTVISTAGANSFGWTFTPTDLSTYRVRTGTISITISKATPTITTVVPSAGNIFFGQTIGSSTITYTGDATNPYNSDVVPGRVVFTTATTKPSSVTTTSYAWTFIADASNNYNNATGTTTSITIVKTTPDISGTLTSTALTFGQLLSSATISGTMKNSFDNAAVAGSFAYTLASTTPPVGTTSYEWTFTPTSTANYNNATGTINVTVNKRTPDVSGTQTATSISFGQPLSASTITGAMRNLNNGAAVAGSFAFTSPSTVLNASTSSQPWTFTPTDTTNYNTATGTVSVTVSKTTPCGSTVVVSATDISFGQTLASSTVSYTSVFTNPFNSVTVGGTIAYTTPTTKPSSAGVSSKSWTFTPSSTSNYNTLTGTVNVNVTQKVPDISGTITASAISFGQSLSASTITGVMRNSIDGSRITGTFTFTFPSTKPSATGSQSWTFTPTDTTNFTTTSGTVSVTVSKTTPCGSLITVSTTGILFGQTLASSTISYTGDFINTFDSAVIPGTIAFTTSSTKPSSVGTASYGWTFTPTNSTNYNTQTGTVNVTTSKSTPDVSGTLTATSITYGRTLSFATISGSMKNAFDNSGVAGSFAYTLPSIVPSAGTASYAWTFTPTVTANYNNVSGTIEVTVNQKTPDVSGTITGSAISFGQTLTSSTISGAMRNSLNSAAVPGTFAFTTPSTKPSATGSQSWTFTPTDSTNYTTTTGTISVTVSKTTPCGSSISVSATGISFGQTLASSTISYTGDFINTFDSATIPGTIAYTTSSTKPSSAGTTSYGWTFTPTNTTNYNTQTGTVSVTINKTTPDISGSLSATTITYGQLLSAATISGTMRNSFDNSSVTGSFAYTLASSTPSAGTTSYDWTFTPTSTTNYNSTSGTINVTVNKRTPDVSGTQTATGIFFGQTLASSTISGAMRNLLNSAAVDGSFAFTTTSTSPSVGTASQAWTFTPTDTSNYNNATGTVSVTVSKTTPDVSGSQTASSIFFGQTIASSTISGSMKNSYNDASVAGTFAFTTSSTKPSAVGTASYAWTFTPTITASYNNATGTVNVTVNQTTPDTSGVITATSIIYGQTLTSSVVSGSMKNSYDNSAVTGTFAFDTPSTKPSSVGTTSFTWSFTPSSANYVATSGTSTISVSKATPDISGSVSASSIDYGQSLSASSLTSEFNNPYDSTVVSGSIAFNTISTPSTAGTSSHSWTFTPVDTTNYNTKTGTVSVTTNAITPVFSYTSQDISYNTASFTTPSVSTNGDGGALTYDISGSIPSGISVNSSTGRVSWSTGIAIGSYTIIVRATNSNSLVGSTTFAYTIRPVKATFTYASQTVGYNTSNTVSPAITYDGGDSSISYSLARSLSSGDISFNPATGAINWTAGIPVGTYTVDVSGFNSSNIVHGTTFTLVVQFVQPDIEYNPDSISIDYDISGDILPTVVFGGGDSVLDYDLSGQLPSADISLNKSTGRIFWNKGIAIGTYPVAVKGITDNGLFDSDIFTLTVNPVKAIFHYADVTINYDVSHVSIPIVDYAGGDASIIYDLSDNLPVPSYMSFSNGTVTLSAGLPVGIHTVSIKGRNSSGLYHYTQFTVTVLAIAPDALAYTSNTTIIEYGVSSEVIVSSIYDGGDSQLTYDISGSAPGNVQVHPSNGRIQIANLTTGSFQIPVRVSNSAGRASALHTVVVQKATPAVSGSFTTQSITYGQTLTSSVLSHSGTVRNPNNNADVSGLFTFTDSTIMPSAGASQSISWTFTPNDNSNYNTRSGTTTIAVAKATPDISRAIVVNTIYYGQTLASADLSGSFRNIHNNAHINGSLAFASPSSKPNAGTNIVPWGFTPSDTNNYETQSGSISVVVNKTTPDISGSLASTTIEYGQLLGDASISGTMYNTYDNSVVVGSHEFVLSAIKPNVGSATHSIRFNPSDNSNYNVKSSTINVTVVRSTPDTSGSIAASSITDDQLLGESTITGTMKNPHDNTLITGTFIFDLSSSNTSVGTTSYGWTFIPSNRTLYNNSTGSVVVQTRRRFISNLGQLTDRITTAFGGNPNQRETDISASQNIFRVNSYVKPAIYADVSNSVLHSKIYRRDFSSSYVPVSYLVGDATTNKFNNAPYKLRMRDVSSNYNVVFSHIPQPYFVSPLTNPEMQTEFAVTYKIVDSLTNNYVEQLDTPIMAQVDLSGYDPKLEYFIYHMDTSTNEITKLASKYNSGSIFEFPVTRNNMLFSTSILPTWKFTTISLPFAFDLSSQSIMVLGEEVSTMDSSFNLTVDMSASLFRQSLLYRDVDACGNIDISFTPMASNLEYEINRLNTMSADSRSLVLSSVPGKGQIDYTQFSASNNHIPPSDGTLLQHFMQYISSIMFGHPQANAPIKNDYEIMVDLSNNNLGRQFITQMTDASQVRHSMIEQLIASDVSGDRFDISDNDGDYHPYPFLAGDKITFCVNMQGKLQADSPTDLGGGIVVSNTSLFSDLFNGIPGISVSPPYIDPRTWKVVIQLV
jgi:predicted heme/steroid binding protein